MTLIESICAIEGVAVSDQGGGGVIFEGWSKEQGKRKKRDDSAICLWLSVVEGKDIGGFKKG